MINKLSYIDMPSGEKIPLAFNMNVKEAIQDKVETVDKWAEKIEIKDNEPINIKDLKAGFKEMINEGIDIFNETAEEKMNPLSDKQVGRVITAMGLGNAAEKILATMQNEMLDDESSETNDNSKNE